MIFNRLKYTAQDDARKHQDKQFGKHQEFELVSPLPLATSISPLLSKPSLTVQHSSVQYQLTFILICRWAKNIDDVTAISALVNVKVDNVVCSRQLHALHAWQVISLSLNSITSLQPFAACTSLK
jgi:hypothetical protein